MYANKDDHWGTGGDPDPRISEKLASLLARYQIPPADPNAGAC